MDRSRVDRLKLKPDVGETEHEAIIRDVGVVECKKIRGGKSPSADWHPLVKAIRMNQLETQRSKESASTRMKQRQRKILEASPHVKAQADPQSLC